MTGRPPARQRILIGAGCYADARNAIDIAERLAMSVGLDIGGLLLDDPTAQDAPATPNQRLVTSSGAMVVVPDRHRMRVVMASDARAFRGHLSRIAESHAGSWSFEQRRGELVRELCNAAQGWDLLMIGHRRLRRNLGAVVSLTPDAAQTDSEATALADILAASLRTRAVRVHANASEKTSLTDLLMRIGRMDVALVVTDAGDGLFKSEDQLRLLVDAARCPVLVLRAARIRPAIAHSAQIPPAPGP